MKINILRNSNMKKLMVMVVIKKNICNPLSLEDMMVQMKEISYVKKR